MHVLGEDIEQDAAVATEDTTFACSSFDLSVLARKAMNWRAKVLATRWACAGMGLVAVTETISASPSEATLTMLEISSADSPFNCFAVRSATTLSPTSFSLVAASRVGTGLTKVALVPKRSSAKPGLRNSSDAEAEYCFCWSSEKPNAAAAVTTKQSAIKPARRRRIAMTRSRSACRLLSSGICGGIAGAR